MEDILARRRILSATIAGQRQSLREEIEIWASPLALVDHGVGVLRYVKRNPLLVAGAVSVLLTLRRRGGSGTWLGRGLLVWRLFSRFRNLGQSNVLQRTDRALPAGPSSRRI